MTTFLSLKKTNSSTNLLKNNIKSRISKVDKSNINITIKHPLDKIIIGLMLGVGHIQQRLNSRFICSQSSLILNHYNYFKIYWIYLNLICLRNLYLNKEHNF